MLVFLNSNGAHGAQIQGTPSPPISRYVYQCRVGPSADAIHALMAMLPEEQVPLWAGRF